jgi:hypothetical protein
MKNIPILPFIEISEENVDLLNISNNSYPFNNTQSEKAKEINVLGTLQTISDQAPTQSQE